MEILNINKLCDCCGSNNLEKLWVYSQKSKQRTLVFNFKVNHSICRECGFVFLSPTYLQTDLNIYYEDSYTYFIHDFDVEYRINFIKKNVIKYGSFLEIGGNDRNDFHDSLQLLFKNVKIQDVNLSGNIDDFQDSLIIPSQFDCLAHYFVLEHVPNVSEFIIRCYDLLKFNGLMIIEVPDLKKYKTFFDPLRFHEHTNHFTIEILERICSKNGFKLIDFDKKSSRLFGFSAIFQKVNNVLPIVLEDLTNYYKTNLRFFKDGLLEFFKYEKFILNQYLEIKKLDDSGKNILFWGANSVLRDIICNNANLKNSIYVDSDLRKENFLDDYGLKVMNPYSNLINFKEIDMLVMCCSKFYLNQILNFLKDEKEVEFNSSQILIVSSFGSNIDQ
jgi:hypothetical protein